MRALLVCVTALAVAVAIAAGVVAVSEYTSADTAQSAAHRDNATLETQNAEHADVSRQIDDLGRRTTAVRLAIANASGSARALGVDFDTMASAQQAVVDLINRSRETGALSQSDRAALTRALDELTRVQNALDNANSDLATSADRLQP